MEEKKIKQINLRLTEDEYKFLKEAAKEWGGSVSAYVLEASKKFRGTDKINKIQFMREWNAEFRKYKTDIDKAGTNINQMAHAVNVMKLQGRVIISEDMVEEVHSFNMILKKLERYVEKSVRLLLK